MIRTILFDMGGTLDGEVHWLERFLALYRMFGIDRSREAIRAAFDEAEQHCSTDETIVSASFAKMLRMHVTWQLEHLGLENPYLHRHLVEGFARSVAQATSENARMLSDLVERGFTLGVVSNGCGNVETLCADFGYSPFLSIIVDSRAVQLFKPNPAIFQYAAKKLGGDPATMIMVGDSFERDVVPARKVGMKTAWLEGPERRECPDPSLLDLRLRRLTTLPAALSTMSTVLV